MPGILIYTLHTEVVSSLIRLILACPNSNFLNTWYYSIPLTVFLQVYF